MIHKGGIGTYIRNVLPGIIACGRFDVSCIGHDTLAEFEWFKNIRFIRGDVPILSLKEQLALPGLIPSCDLLWVPNWNVTVLPVKARRIVMTFHDANHYVFASEFPWLKIQVMKAIIGRNLKRASAVVTVSDFSKRELMRYTHTPADKIDVVPLAVADDFNQGFPFKKLDKRYILFVGNVKPHKNLGLALRAFSHIRDRDVRFLVVGKREGFITPERNLDGLVEQLGDRVEFTGEVSEPDLKNFYANAALFLFPSKYEGFGLPVLEAMKFSIPILASNAASIPEVGGNCVEYFDPGNEKELTEKLDLFFSGRWHSYMECYAQQLRRFSWSKTVEAHINCFIKNS
jgi:glycosyltransferase involved in cell wall biosynthesis